MITTYMTYRKGKRSDEKVFVPEDFGEQKMNRLSTGILIAVTTLLFHSVLDTVILYLSEHDKDISALVICIMQTLGNHSTCIEFHHYNKYTTNNRMTCGICVARVRELQKYINVSFVFFN